MVYSTATTIFIFLLPLLFFLCLLSSSSAVLDDLSLTRQASSLISLKKSFHVADSKLESWRESNYTSICSWYGIKCHSMSIVVELDISNANISGTITPVISELKGLQYLSLAGNNFSGSFPVEICNLTRLKVLNISNNQFNGSLNWNFNKLKDLEVLDLYNNDFSGFLPPGISELRKLKHLDFGGSYFSGRIPESYGDLEELSYLSLAGNDLSGYIPPHLGNLTNLRQIYLGYYNEFEGGIPPEFGKLINLVHLDLSSCGLTGSIPPELGNLNKLDTIFLQTNQLTGAIPPQFGNLSCLRTLDLSNNALTSEIPIEFSELKNLTLLHLFINKFHGEIPSSIAELPNLEVLKLWQNNFTGVIPRKLGRNGRLTELDLSTNKLTGFIPRHLCSGRRLEILILLNNFLFGHLHEDLGQCTTLLRVRLGQNFLSGSIPSGLLYLPELSLLELHNNYFTGNFSDEKRKVASKLGQLNLSNNRLTGILPSSIGNFSSLQIILLNRNQFTGEIPSEIGNLKNVLKIDLSRNNISGSIPPEIGDCSSLTYLDLSQNQFIGQIPDEISQIHILNYLNLSWNQLNGSFPKSIAFMKSLTSADFSHNDLSGRIPETGEFAYFNSTSFIGNPRLCGMFFKPCNDSSEFSWQSEEQYKSKPPVSGKFKLIFALGLLACSLVFIVSVIVRTRTIWRKNQKPWKLTAFQKLNFRIEDILDCLKENNIIGRGGSGIVYRGTMPNGQQIAVKRLLGINKGSTHDNGFSAEIQTLGKIRHRNIVRLLAFCTDKESKLLVYEYMSHGSLGEVLHGKKGGYLKWDMRLKIAMEAARGLCYLHHDCCPPILHRDVKSNNILLDSDFEAHVADFGLAKFLQNNGTSECMSSIAGSYGYIAPEYAYTLKVDEKSDVYSFGVVLLELLTGRWPVGDFQEEGLDIVQWARMKTEGNKDGVTKILDERLMNVPLSESIQVFFVGMLCVQEHSVERPTMREVVQMLAQAKQSETFHVH